MSKRKQHKQTKETPAYHLGRSVIGLAAAKRRGAGSGIHHDRRLRRLRTRDAQKRQAFNGQDSYRPTAGNDSVARFNFAIIKVKDPT